MSQAFIFLCFLSLGVLLGIVYDMFKILRVHFNSGNIFILILDVFYFVVYTLSLFLLNLIINMGQTRYFFILSSFFGTISYKLAISNFVWKKNSHNHK